MTETPEVVERWLDHREKSERLALEQRHAAEQAQQLEPEVAAALANTLRSVTRQLARFGAFLGIPHPWGGELAEELLFGICVALVVDLLIELALRAWRKRKPQ